MQFASASFPRRLIRRTREGIPGGAVWTSILVFLLALTVAKSTVTVVWVPGTEVITLVALSGAILMGLLALAPIPWGAGVGIGMLAGPFVAGYAAWPAAHAANPTDPLNLGLLHVWWGRIQDGSAITMDSFDLFLICWLMWVTGGWLAWCALRWRRPLLGLVPGAAAFATNLLNYPKDQNGYVLAVLVLTLALLLWSNYTESIANAARARVKLTGDARWDFWESGLVAMAALIVIAIMLPPISTIDRTTDTESSAFTSWAQLLETLNHPGQSGGGVGGGSATTGFSPDVLLNSSLKRTHTPVFSYTLKSSFVGPHYFRGVDDTLLLNGAWRYQETNVLKQALPNGQVPAFGEDYSKLALADFSVRMTAPPSASTDVLFYPGRLYKVNRDAMAIEEIVPPPDSPGLLMNIDRLSSVNPGTSRGTYDVTVEYSTATEADLQAAGTAYPDWVSAYTPFPKFYRSPAVLESIHSLALQIVRDAGAQTPYEAATAIETYLRSDKFQYSLTMQQPRGGEDPLAYFLFTTHKGYCEFFATAMGDMLRSLGIPTRLVSGFGPGQLDHQTNVNVVHSDDAHTWVEVYFPKYGWIEFEPTNDNVYFPIQRGAGATACFHDNQCTDPNQVTNTSSPTPGVGIRPGSESNLSPTGGNGNTGIRFGVPDPGTLTKIVGFLLAVLLVLVAAVARYLRPRTVMGVWRRTLALTRLAGVDERSGETPFEISRRLVMSFPEASEHIRSLAGGFVVAAYAPPDEARSARASVMEAWSALRPLLLRRAFKRFRPI
jgi:hypothetical protein